MGHRIWWYKPPLGPNTHVGPILLSPVRSPPLPASPPTPHRCCFSSVHRSWVLTGTAPTPAHPRTFATLSAGDLQGAQSTRASRRGPKRGSQNGVVSTWSKENAIAEEALRSLGMSSLLQTGSMEKVAVDRLLEQF